MPNQDMNYIEPGTKCGYHSGTPTFGPVKEGTGLDQSNVGYKWPINCDHPAKHRIWNEMFHGSNVYCDCHDLIVQIEHAEAYLSNVDSVRANLEKCKKELAEVVCPGVEN